MAEPRARWRFTDRGDGDLAVDAGEGLERRRRAVADGRWTWLRQVHGAAVVEVDGPGAHAGESADAAVTSATGAVLAVQVADCVPVLLEGETNGHPVAVGAVHAGWRGLAAGVVPAAVEALHRLGATTVVAHLGPHIRVPCYEFGAHDLDRVAEALGDGVRGTTAWSAPALDLTAGVRAALTDAGVGRIDDVGTCTACSPVHYSHRAGGDRGRQAGVVWLERS